MVAVLRDKFGHASAERALSGMGLVNLYEALCTIDGVAAAALDPAGVTAAAIGGSDARCVEAVEIFFGFLGHGRRQSGADAGRDRRDLHRRRHRAAARRFLRPLGILRPLRGEGTLQRLVAGIPTFVIHARDLARTDRGCERARRALSGGGCEVSPPRRKTRQKKTRLGRAFVRRDRRAGAWQSQHAAPPPITWLNPASTYEISPVMPDDRSDSMNAATLPTSSIVTVRAQRRVLLEHAQQLAEALDARTRPAS